MIFSGYRHYQDAYETLTIMFGSTAILPPRTKRWAEAKVLVDCINIKVRASTPSEFFSSQCHCKRIADRETLLVQQRTFLGAITS